jgi:CheY-like chemotaxis protein
MSGDLVLLRMLVIAAARPEQELWRQAAAMASIPVEFSTQEPASAADVFPKTGVDICVVDADLPDANRFAVIDAARAAQPAPLIFVSAPKDGARIDGVDGMLTKPSGLAEARKLVEICIRAKIPTRILIVDDSSTIRSIVRKVLLASHFTLDVHETAESIDAFERLRSGKFGMVFLDHNMPGLDGVETLSQIKRENPNVAVVMMTATVDRAIAGRAREAGAFAFLKKPFYPVDINRVLEHYYGLHVSLG